MHPLFSAAPGALGCLEASGKERNCASSGGTLFVGHGGERRPEGARLYRYFSFFCPLTDPVPGRLFCLLKRLFQGCERARRRSVVAKEFRKSAPQLAHSAAGRRKPERSHRSMRVEAKRSLAGHSFERAAGVGLREAVFQTCLPVQDGEVESVPFQMGLKERLNFQNFRSFNS
jgi:hypothetical protein